MASEAPGRAAHWAWFVPALVVLTGIVYAPARGRVFVTDHINYAAELGGSERLADGLGHLDYSLTRRYYKGDEALYRPLLFAWLATANAWFSYDHVAWNVATLGLHVLVCLALFGFLQAIRPGFLSGLVALLFSVLRSGAELVLWQHLGGYLLGYAFLLVGLGAATRWSEPRSRLVYVASMTLACFFTETMAASVAVIGGFVAWRRRAEAPPLTRREAAMLILPVALFASAYAARAASAERLTYVDRGRYVDLLEGGNVAELPVNMGRALARWSVEAAAPALIRSEVRPFERFQSRLGRPADAPTLWLNLALLAAAAVVFRRGLSGAGLRRSAVFAAMLLAYSGIVCFGRTLYPVTDASYYGYYFSLLAILWVHGALEWDRVAFRPAVAILLLLIVLHATLTFRLNLQVEEANRGPDRYFRALGAFVDEHRHEPSFTFAVRNPPADADPPYLLLEGYPDASVRRPTTRRVSEILFAPYLDPIRPRVWFTP